MSVTAHDVRHIAALARLEVEEARVPVLVDEMNRILDYVGVLQNVDIGFPRDPVAGPHATDAATGDAPLRDDVPSSVPLASPIASFAPAERDGFFLVPRLATHE